MLNIWRYLCFYDRVAICTVALKGHHYISFSLYMLSRSVSLSGARLVLGWSLEDAAMDFFDHLRSLGISEEEIRKMRDDLIFSAIHKKRVTKLTCQMYGGPERTSLHKFFIALHKFWLVWKNIMWLSIHNYLACIHNYLVCIHKYLTCIHNYLTCIHN